MHTRFDLLQNPEKESHKIPGHRWKNIIKMNPTRTDYTDMNGIGVEKLAFEVTGLNHLVLLVCSQFASFYDTLPH